MGRRNSVAGEPFVDIDGDRLGVALEAARLANVKVAAMVERRGYALTAANLGRMVKGTQGRCKASLRSILADVVLSGVSGGDQWLGGENVTLGVSVPVEEPVRPEGIHLPTRGLTLRVNRGRIGLEGDLAGHDLLRLRFVARAWPCVAYYDRRSQVLEAFWSATDGITGRHLAARESHGPKPPPLPSDRPLTEHDFERDRAEWRAYGESSRAFYDEPTAREAISFCRSAIAMIEVMIARYLPPEKGADPGRDRPKRPVRIPPELLDSFAFHFGGGGWAWNDVASRDGQETP